jgi:hypothetical protein
LIYDPRSATSLVSRPFAEMFGELLDQSPRRAAGEPGTDLSQ